MRAPPFALALLSLLVLVAASGCLVDPTVPPDPVGRPASCGNALCELSLEDSIDCPLDCPPCGALTAVATTNGVANAINATGATDNKFATIAAGGAIELIFGGEAFDLGNVTDFELVGSVSSTSLATTDTCNRSRISEGALTVEARAGGSWILIGIWTQNKSAFDLGCVGMPRAKEVRIVGLSKARATLDAVKITACR